MASNVLQLQPLRRPRDVRVLLKTLGIFLRSTRHGRDAARESGLCSDMTGVSVCLFVGCYCWCVTLSALFTMHLRLNLAMFTIRDLGNALNQCFAIEFYVKL